MHLKWCYWDVNLNLVFICWIKFITTCFGSDFNFVFQFRLCGFAIICQGILMYNIHIENNKVTSIISKNPFMLLSRSIQKFHSVYTVLTTIWIKKWGSNYLYLFWLIIHIFHYYFLITKKKIITFLVNIIKKTYRL